MTEETVQEQAPKTIEIPFGELKAMRAQRFKQAVEQEIQGLIQQAAVYQKNIQTAKTEYKKKFYAKKLKTLNGKVMQMIVALQRFEAETQPPTQQQENASNNSTEAKTTE